MSMLGWDKLQMDYCTTIGWNTNWWMGFKEKNGVNLLDNWYLLNCTRVVMKDKDYVG
jgi:hypothetical protein